MSIHFRFCVQGVFYRCINVHNACVRNITAEVDYEQIKNRFELWLMLSAETLSSFT